MREFFKFFVVWATFMLWAGGAVADHHTNHRGETSCSVHKAKSAAVMCAASDHNDDGEGPRSPDPEVEALLWPLDVFDGDYGDSIIIHPDDLIFDPGSVIILGEQDGIISEQLFEGVHLGVMALQSKQITEASMSVGFGDIAYNQQEATRDYAAGRMSEDDFLSAVHWVPSLPLALYELHFKAPELVGGQVWALGQPLQNLIAYYGLEGLSEEETALLPPTIIEGDAGYKKRFFEYAQRRVEPALALERRAQPAVASDEGGMNESLRMNLEKRYIAQRVQDSTVAWRIQQAMQENPEQILVVLVEDISMRYNGGVLQALDEYGVSENYDVLTMSQAIAYAGQSTQEVAKPHAEYGARADYIVVREDEKRKEVEQSYRDRALKFVKWMFDQSLDLIKLLSQVQS